MNNLSSETLHAARIHAYNHAVKPFAEIESEAMAIFGAASSLKRSHPENEDVVKLHTTAHTLVAQLRLLRPFKEAGTPSEEHAKEMQLVSEGVAAAARHMLNNTLTAIQLSVESAGLESHDPDAMQHINHILETVGRLPNPASNAIFARSHPAHTIEGLRGYVEDGEIPRQYRR